MLVQTNKVFSGRRVIHYPSDGNGMKKCSCGRIILGAVLPDCNYYLFAQLGSPSFTILELNSRLRRFYEQIQYDSFIYTQPQHQAEQQQLLLTNFVHSETIHTIDEEADVDKSIVWADNVSDEDKTCNTDDYKADLAIQQDVQNLLLGDQEYNSDLDDDNDYEPEEQSTLQQEQRAASTEFNDTLEKIFNDAES